MQHGLTTIERSAKAQAQLIDDLLDVSRIVAGKLRLDVQVVQPDRRGRGGARVGPPRRRRQGRPRSSTCSTRRRPGQRRPGRLQQVVWNLLSNAVKFTPKGGVVQVVAASGDDSHVAIVVSDTGIGIAPTFLPHVFERFRQADASTTRRYGGLGLGLAIVRHLIELHGGTVRADSPGEGQRRRRSPSSCRWRCAGHAARRRSARTSPTARRRGATADARRCAACACCWSRTTPTRAS